MRQCISLSMIALLLCVASVAANSLAQKPNWDVKAATMELTAIAKDSPGNMCATHVRLALEKGGLDVSKRPKDAKDYGSFLTGLGFVEVAEKDYTPQAGDVVVLQPYEGGSKEGHVAMYSGSQWISDFKQTDFWGGPGYRSKKPPHSFYRK